MSMVYHAACEMPISHLYGNFQTTLFHIGHVSEQEEYEQENNSL